jgi:hypothetical protein
MVMSNNNEGGFVGDFLTGFISGFLDALLNGGQKNNNFSG